jgi:hypothetical protein
MIFDPYDIFGDEEIGENTAKISKFTMKEAIANLLLVEAKVTRNKKDGRKSVLQVYQSVQGLALFMGGISKNMNTSANSCHISFSTL